MARNEQDGRIQPGSRHGVRQCCVYRPRTTQSYMRDGDHVWKHVMEDENTILSVEVEEPTLDSFTSKYMYTNKYTYTHTWIWNWIRNVWKSV